tara:strand:- start:152 stop:451 length:300 start_codon:yes stop_codon:yes gene_type:complete
MAINKKQQIPSPSKISTSPTSFSEEELNQLRKLKNDINYISYELGSVAIQKVKLKELEENLLKQLSTIDNDEKIIAKKLTSKYGKGSIDSESGTFTPTE